MATVCKADAPWPMKKKKLSPPISFSPPSVVARPIPTREEITQRAETLWLQKGRPESCDEQIWLEAERQLSGAPGAFQGSGEPAVSLPLSHLDLNTDEVMSELGELFPERSGRETTSL
jgi:hypothetical protein